MASANARRIARLEARRAAVVPNVVEVRTGETLDEALARFAERHGRLPSAFIATPTRATDDELPDLEPLWADQQRRLVADARTVTRKLKEEGNGKRNARIRTVQYAPGGNGLHHGHRTPLATRRMGGEGGTIQG